MQGNSKMPPVARYTGAGLVWSTSAGAVPRASPDSTSTRTSKYQLTGIVSGPAPDRYTAGGGEGGGPGGGLTGAGSTPSSVQQRRWGLQPALTFNAACPGVRVAPRAGLDRGAKCQNPSVGRV